MIGCPIRVIADACNCSHDVIERRYKAQLIEGRTEGQVRALGKIYHKGVINGEYKSLELYALNVCHWSTRPQVAVVTNVVQTAIPQSPQEIKARLVELQKVITAEAMRQNDAPQLANG